MIEGAVIKDLRLHKDGRGWLSELFRMDELPDSIHPKMAYLSLTLPGVTRGPHEHLKQTDMFFFAGPSNFKVYLWDNRGDSKTYKERMTFIAGEDSPKIVIIPPRVVHAYKNIGNVSGFVFNSPNLLYKGYGKKEEVDEMRYEDIESQFVMD